jgi:sulfotransferase family protein
VIEQIKTVVKFTTRKMRTVAKNVVKPFIHELSDAERAGRVQRERFEQSDLIWICFPKSGSTWLEVMLTHYFVKRYGAMTERVRDLYPISCTLPSVAVTVRTHDDDPHLKTVDQFETDKSKYRHKRVLFLARDPRDILVSYYFEYTKKKEYIAAKQLPFNGSIDDFIHHNIGGLRAIIRFYNIWAEHVDVPREFNIITYESIRANPREELCRVLEIIDSNPIDPACVENAVAFGAFDNMRQLEERSAPGLVLNPHVTIGDIEGYKVRRGKVSGYIDYLSQRSIAECDSIVRSELSDYFVFYKL